MISRQSLAWVCLAVAAAWGLAVPCTAQQAEKARTLVRAGHVLDVKTGKAGGCADDRGGGGHHSIHRAHCIRSRAAGRCGCGSELMTVMPGLIDVHTHLTMNTDFDPYLELTSTDAKEAINGVVNARTTLMAGFTSVRNVGASGFTDVDLRDAINAGQVAGAAHAGERAGAGNHGRSLRRQSAAVRSTTQWATAWRMELRRCSTRFGRTSSTAPT